VERPSWVLLIYRLPREPSRHRVAVWRKLRDLGALYLQDGVAALPEDAVTREQLEWLQLRVREAGGEATLWEARPGTVAEEAELVEDFRASREEAYRAIIAGAERVRRKAQMGGGETLLEQLGKLEREFRAQGLLPLPAAPRSGWSTQGRPRSRKGARSSDQGPRRREKALMLWATRRGCHVDRTACIWLIRRFVDPDASFAFFGDPAEAPEGAELFDVVGARLSHRGEDCSFETFLRDYDLIGDPVLGEIAEIVHDADLMDEKYARPESEGLDAIVRGMQLSLPDDQTLSGYTDVLYDGLYAYLSREVL
jgi:hypothetical protein